mgnify:CR=1 FL=1
MLVYPDELKRLREARALTQEALAAKCGLSRKTIQRIERGEPVRDETLAFIAGALGVAVTDFSDSSACSTAGPAVSRSRCPASVSATLRDVRVSNATPTRASS